MIAFIITMSIATLITRNFSFIFLKNYKDHPCLLFLGHHLPLMVMPILVLYCFRELSFNTFPFGLPEFIASTCVIICHIWKRNILLSILGGTTMYILIQNSIL